MEKGFLACLTGLLAGLMIAVSVHAASDGKPLPMHLMDVVESALEQHPDILIAQKDVRINQGLMQQEGGVFDTTLIADAYLSKNDQEIASTSTSTARVIQQREGSGFSLGLEKELALGASASLQAGVNQTESVLSSDTSSSEPVNTSEIRFSLAILG